MNGPTPEQIRALADDGDDRADYAHTRTPEMVHTLTAALRAAADQLAAVTSLVADVGSQRDYWADRAAAVERVADMAQDDEDGNGWVPISPLLDALYPEKRGVSNE
ncbi:hypothetical protein [Curtobacterium sp. USHLN213]|uniref:hypothetical protein n=1 Tax=Curtobacterium sp. USHLN213 TaxID=3081255 RepID=UPI003019FAE4